MFIDLAGLIDVETEITRKKEEIARIEQFIAGKEKKLANANFVLCAPEAVVQKERDGLADLRSLPPRSRFWRRWRNLSGPFQK